MLEATGVAARDVDQSQGSSPLKAFATVADEMPRFSTCILLSTVPASAFVSPALKESAKKLSAASFDSTSKFSISPRTYGSPPNRLPSSGLHNAHSHRSRAHIVFAVLLSFFAANLNRALHCLRNVPNFTAQRDIAAAMVTTVMYQHRLRLRRWWR